MHFEDIKAEIRKAHSSPAAIARHFDVRPASVSLVLRGATKSARIAKEISRITGKKVGELWPGKYPELAFAEKLISKKSPAQLEAELRSMHTPSRRAATGRKAVAA